MERLLVPQPTVALATEDLLGLVLVPIGPWALSLPLLGQSE